MSRTLKFLQISDLHLDSSLAGNTLQFPLKKRSVVTQDTLTALDRALSLARSEHVDVILIPGDVWDDECISLQTAVRFFELIGSVGDIPVLITPGNRDPYHSSSYYDATYFSHKSSKQHPPNLTLFKSGSMSSVRLPQLPGVAFFGCCFSGNAPRPERMLNKFHPEPAFPGELLVLLYHGSRDIPETPAIDQAVIAPFSSDEILESGIHYAALGHRHHYEVITDSEGKIRGAYSGVPLARGLDTAHEHYVIIGEITSEGVDPDALHRENVDPREIFRLAVEVDPTVTNEPALRERLRAALDSACVAPADIAFIELKGKVHPDVGHLELDPEWCDQQCFHLAVDQRKLQPDYNFDSLLSDQAAHKRVDGRFLERMATLIDEAHQQGDERRLRLLRTALVAGLDALNGREVRPRHVY